VKFFFVGQRDLFVVVSGGVVIVLLGIYLLAAIIVGVAVRSKYSGALVNKNWHKKTVRSRSLTRASQFGTRGVTN